MAGDEPATHAVEALRELGLATRAKNRAKRLSHFGGTAAKRTLRAALARADGLEALEARRTLPAAADQHTPAGYTQRKRCVVRCALHSYLVRLRPGMLIVARLLSCYPRARW